MNAKRRPSKSHYECERVCVCVLAKCKRLARIAMPIINIYLNSGVNSSFSFLILSFYVTIVGTDLHSKIHVLDWLWLRLWLWLWLASKEKTNERNNNKKINTNNTTQLITIKTTNTTSNF